MFGFMTITFLGALFSDVKFTFFKSALNDIFLIPNSAYFNRQISSHRSIFCQLKGKQWKKPLKISKKILF